MSSIRRLFPRSPADQPAICLSKAARASMLIVGTHRSTIMWRALLILLAIFFRYVSADSHGESPPEVSLYNGTLYAACRMTPSSTLAWGLPRATGLVLFKQVDPHEKVRVLFRISGLKTVGECDKELRAVHIHQYGDLSLGCDTTGGHYNPSGVNHPNHPGDFGNLVPKDGIINVMGESEATLFGGLSVIGRAVVMHERRDDLGFGGDAGSLLHGDAGPRLSCCVIGRSTARLWNIYYKIYERMLNSN